jgi:hypothetical protein
MGSIAEQSAQNAVNERIGLKTRVEHPVSDR